MLNEDANGVCIEKTFYPEGSILSASLRLAGTCRRPAGANNLLKNMQ